MRGKVIIKSCGLLMAILTATVAMPVSHGETHPLSSSGQYGKHLVSQDLDTHPQSLQFKSHESLANVDHWVNALLVDKHTSPAGSTSSTETKPDNTYAMHARPVNEKQSFQSNADYLKWIESVLNDDDDHHTKDHAFLTTISPSSFVPSDTYTLQTSSSRPLPPSSFGASSHDNRPALSTTPTVTTKKYATLGSTKTPRKPKWSNGRSSEAKANIRKGLDQLVIAKFGSIASHRRKPFAAALTKEQLNHLAEGHSPFQMPGPALRDPSKTNRRRSWKAGLNDKDVQTIMAFGDVLMAQTRASSATSRNNILSSLTKEELEAIARGDEEEKNRIAVKMAPKTSRHYGAWYSLDDKQSISST